MSVYLMAVTWNLELLWVILQVALGLGAVIFVHELGHFLVAKACGVKCEKFYIGFDIGGYKIWHRQWGETEYGVGVLPLGGYVKMLGQDDNPSKIAEEAERSKVRAEGDSPEMDGGATSDGDESYEIDPRSYLAKSVPQRMAIISAGVIMNLIFGYLFAVVAFRSGVKYTPAAIGDVLAGSPAWRADLRPDDAFHNIDGRTEPWFRDLLSRVVLFDQDRGLPVTFRRPGEEKNRELTLTPNFVAGRPVPSIGVTGPRTLELAETSKESFCGRLKLPMRKGDLITAVDGQTVQTYGDLVAHFAQRPTQDVQLTITRAIVPEKSSVSLEQSDSSPTAGRETLTVTIPPRPMMRIGLVMGLPRLTAVQEGTPAAAAGLKPGDTITELNGEPVGDPSTLPQRALLAAQSDGAIKLTLRRKNDASQVDDVIEVKLPYRAPYSFEQGMTSGDPLALSGMGLAYQVSNRIEQVLPDSPASNAKVTPGETIASFKFLELKEGGEGLSKRAKTLVNEDPIKFDEDQQSWPMLVRIMQNLPDGVQLELTLKKGKTTRNVTLLPTASDGLYWADRGIATEAMRPVLVASTWNEACRLAGRELWYSVTMVYRFLQKIGHQVPIKMLGGPLTIAQVAGLSAFDGPGNLLLFLTMLSANLAVINFLPIPLLDGGHMVFLAWEGVFRKPMSERIMIAFHMLGFAFIIGLMLFVIGLDVGRLLGLT